MRTSLSLLGLVPIVTLSSIARAQDDEPTPAAPAAPAPAEPTPPASPPQPPPVQLTPMPFGKPVKQGVAFGFESGLWGSFFLQAVRLRIPFTPAWGMAVKGLLTHPTDHSGNVHPHFGGGRVDILSSSPIVMGFARLYGGGGVTVATKVLGTGGNTDVHFGATAYFGFEFFVSRAVSFMTEIGGGSNIDGSAAGASVTAGVQLYLGS
jgi:hypothetical protein